MKRLLASLTLASLLATAPTAGAIEEDEPGWDCHVDGNHICDARAFWFSSAVVGAGHRVAWDAIGLGD